MECLFCKIVDGAIPAKKVYEDDDVFAFHDINPQAPVHVLIIPKEHYAKVSDLDGKQTVVIGSLFHAANRIATELGIAESGYRLVINNGRDANQTVWHIHLHLLGGRSMGWPPG